MLNYLWIFMILVGIIYGAATGHLEEVSNAFLTGSEDAVSLCISMTGILCMWTGIMEIAKKGGLISQLTHFLSPFIHALFPEIPEDHKAFSSISLNIAANILGLGWASTPSGLTAMKELAALNHYSQTASPAMCNFLILNISSLQLIPVNIIAYRSQYHSASPAAVTGPGLLCTIFSSLTAILFIRIMSQTNP